MSVLKSNRWAQALAAAALATLTAVLVAACGSDPTPTPRPTATPQPTPTAMEPAATPTPTATLVPGAPTPTPSPPTPTPEPTATPHDFWGELIAAAQEEGKLVPVTTGGTAQGFELLFEQFSEQFGIEVSQQRGRGTDTVPKIVAERANGRYTVDTWQSGPGSSQQIASIGGMRPFEEALVIPENRFKAIWRDQRYRFVDSEEMFMFAYAATLDKDTLWFNTNLVDPAEVTSIRDQLDPRWIGMIARERVPQTDSLARTYVAPGGKEFLEELWSGGYIRIIEDIRACEDSLARGTVAFANCGGNASLETLVEQGLPVMEKEVDGFPSWRVGSSESIGLMDQGPNPNAGKLWINWLISPAGWEARKQLVRDDPVVGARFPGMSLRSDVTNDHIPADTQIPATEPLYILVTDPTYIDTLQEAIEWIRPIVVAAGYPSPPDRHPDLIGGGS